MGHWHKPTLILFIVQMDIIIHMDNPDDYNITGNDLCITTPFWGQMARDSELWCFLCSQPN